MYINYDKIPKKWSLFLVFINNICLFNGPGTILKDYFDGLFQKGFVNKPLYKVRKKIQPISLGP